jgi:spermidine synthase
MNSEPVVVERVQTPRGELVLRTDGEHYEVISNGMFLMDTRNGRSERELVSAALEHHPAPELMLIGGLGVGFSLVEALADERLARVDVVEIEPALVDWHRSHLASYSGGALDVDRVRLIVGDIADELRSTSVRYDLMCLDVDNGPTWTVTPANAALYDDDATALIASRLRPDGVLSVWSAASSPEYEAILHRHFESVARREIMVARGEPDVVMVASGPRGVRRRDDDCECSAGDPGP